MIYSDNQLYESPSSRSYIKRNLVQSIRQVSDSELLNAIKIHIDNISTEFKIRTHLAIGSYFRGIDSVELFRKSILNQIIQLLDEDIVLYLPKTMNIGIRVNSRIRNSDGSFHSLKFFSQYNVLTPEMTVEVSNFNTSIFIESHNTHRIAVKTAGHIGTFADRIILDMLYVYNLLLSLSKDNRMLYNRILRFMKYIINKASSLDDDGPEFMDDVEARLIFTNQYTLKSIYPYFFNLHYTEGNRMKVRNWNLYASRILSLSTL